MKVPNVDPEAVVRDNPVTIRGDRNFIHRRGIVSHVLQERRPGGDVPDFDGAVFTA